MNMNSLKKAASGAIGKAKSAIKSTVNKGKAIVKKAEKKLTSAINGAKANVKKCVQTVKTNVNKIENKAKQIGKTAQKNLISAVNGAKSSKKTVIQNQTKPINKNMGNLQKSLIAATGTTVYNNAVIPTGKKQTNGAINVANLPVYNRAGNYIEGQKVKVKGLDGKWYVGTAKAEGYIGTGGARQFKFLPDNPGGYKRAIDVDYNYNLYKKSMFERAYNKNLDFTAQEIQGKIVHDAPWRYKKNALNDYFKTPNDFVEYNKKVYLISTEQYGFDPKVNEQYAQLAADFTVGMLFEGGITCGIVAKSGMSKAVAGSGAGNIKKGGNKTNFGFKYKHNPSDNPKVLKDAIEDPNAVYGYRPSEDGSLASFVKGEWDDPIAVEGYRQDRIAYHNRNEGAAQQMVSNMFSEGASTEDVARAVNEYRNQSRIQAYIDSNGNIKNIDGYNAALVRAEKNSYENLIKSGKTPEQIIKSATKGNPGMDACTGLYDEYFDTY